jgi:mannose-6-phosphate isomerase-like protein (cupin superfamily)
MNISETDIIDLKQLIQNAPNNYKNCALTQINDHVVRMGVMTEDYFWHYHPNSDETFMVIDGTLLLDLETGTIELNEGQMLTIPKNMPHRTRPKGARSINLTIELNAMETVRIADK